MRKMSVLDLLYPRHCPLCGQVRPFGEGTACEECMKQAEWVREPVCMKCGKPILYEEAEYCQDCVRLPKSYVRGFPVFVYRTSVQEAVAALKYQNQRVYADFFADCMAARYGETLAGLGIDGLVPVPVHKNRRRRRGYNQAEVLARCLGRRINRPVYPDFLRRIRDTEPQKELNDRQRLENIKSAFKIGENRIKLEQVLLVDDIYTTGATVEACTRVLLAAGVKKVYYTSVAIGKGY